MKAKEKDKDFLGVQGVVLRRMGGSSWSVDRKLGGSAG